MQEKRREQLKNLLLTQRKQILKNLKGFSDEIEELDHADLNDDLDYANVASDKSIEGILGNQQAQKLLEIDHSLAKFDNNTFGVCEECKKSISVKRLMIKPHARFCIACREMKEETRIF